MKYWEIIVDNLHNTGWSLGWVSAVNREGRTIWIVDAHGNGKRFVAHTDEKLTAFLDRSGAIRKILLTLSRPVWQSRASALGISSLGSFAIPEPTEG
jgi:hypothetical protein